MKIFPTHLLMSKKRLRQHGFCEWISGLEIFIVEDEAEIF